MVRRRERWSTSRGAPTAAPAPPNSTTIKYKSHTSQREVACPEAAGPPGHLAARFGAYTSGDARGFAQAPPAGG